MYSCNLIPLNTFCIIFHQCSSSSLCNIFVFLYNITFLEIQACTPNPCQHNGRCFTNEDSSFTCNCTGTMYTGMQCNIGIVNIPEYPYLSMNTPYTFTITASPDKHLKVFVLPDDKSSLTINPSYLEFNESINANNFTITIKKSGRFQLNYRLSGESASNFMQLKASNILVKDNQSKSLDSNNYFTSRGLQYGLIQSGCCIALTSQLVYKCPLESSIVKFRASCGWNLKGLYSTGIVFSDNDGLGFPIAIGGIKFEHNFDLLNLNVFELEDTCISCSGNSLGKIDDSLNSSSEKECDIFKPSLNDILSFLESESLAYTYFHHSHKLLPQWLRFNVTSTKRAYTSNSYKVTLVESSEIEALELCNLDRAHSEGLHSVLIYSGALVLTINSEEITYMPKSESDAFCFAVNLCEEKMSPLSISIPNDAKHDLQSLNIFNTGSWKVDFNSISISNHIIPLQQHKKLTGTFWNGDKDLVVNLQDINMVLDVNISYSSWIEDIAVHFSFAGKMYLLSDDIEMVFAYLLLQYIPVVRLLKVAVKLSLNYIKTVASCIKYRYL